MMMASMQQQQYPINRNVCGTNNLGVDFFEKQEFSNAFKCFREALHQLKLRLSSENRDSRSCSSCQSSKPVIQSIVPRSTPDLGTSSCLLPKSETTFVIHSHTFNLGEGIQFSSDPVEENKMLSATLIFNSALIFQLEGIKAASKQHMSKAMMLYRQGYTLLHDYMHTETPSGNALLDLLCMATLNNLGLVSRDLQMSSEARECFALLIRYVHTIRDDESSTSEPAAMKTSSSSTFQVLEAHINIFILNAALLGCSCPLTAPAA